MSIDHDARMIAHAKARGVVTVHEGDRLVAVGALVAWRPNRTRPGANGQPLTRSTYTAVVRIDPNGRTRTYPLNRYTVEPCA